MTPRGLARPPPISCPSGVARPRQSRDPSSALRFRAPRRPRPRAPRGARPRRSPRKSADAEPRPRPRPRTHFSRAWLSEGTAEPLPPLAYMLLRAAAAGAHTCQAAPRAALAVAIATPRPGPHRPEPRAGTAGIVRAGELQTAAAAAAAAAPAPALAAGWLFFPPFPPRGLFRETRAPLLPPRAPPPAASPPPAGAALKGAMAGARVGPAARTAGQARTRSARCRGWGRGYTLAGQDRGRPPRDAQLIAAAHARAHTFTHLKWSQPPKLYTQPHTFAATLNIALYTTKVYPAAGTTADSPIKPQAVTLGVSPCRATHTQHGWEPPHTQPAQRHTYTATHPAHSGRPGTTTQATARRHPASHRRTLMQGHATASNSRGQSPRR